MKVLSKTLLALYLLILLWLILFKLSLNLSSVLDYQTRSLNLIPFAHASRDNLSEMIYNAVVFIPFGLLLGVNLKRANFWQRLAFIVVLSLAVETLQFVFAIGITDITDVIMNTFGGFLGLILYAFSQKYVNNEKLDRFIVVAGTILLIAFLLLLGFLLAHGVRYHFAPGKALQAIEVLC